MKMVLIKLGTSMIFMVKRIHADYLPSFALQVVYSNIPFFYLFQYKGFDKISLDMIPKPVAAIIFLYPVNDIAKQFRQEEKEKLTRQGQNISDEVIYFKQTIGNACGMMALIHALANNKQVLGIYIYIYNLATVLSVSIT